MRHIREHDCQLPLKPKGTCHGHERTAATRRHPPDGIRRSGNFIAAGFCVGPGKSKLPDGRTKLHSLSSRYLYPAISNQADNLGIEEVRFLWSGSRVSPCARGNRRRVADVEDIDRYLRKFVPGGVGQYRLVSRSTALPFELVHVEQCMDDATAGPLGNRPSM